MREWEGGQGAEKERNREGTRGGGDVGTRTICVVEG